MKESVKTIATKTKELFTDKALCKELKLIAVAYSHIEREMFATEDAYNAELEVEERAKQVVETLKKLGFNVKSYASDPYFLTNIIVDKPDLLINLVDTVKGRDELQESIPAILEFAGIEYTGSGISGLVVGNNRNYFKQLLITSEIPSPQFKYIKDLRSNTEPDFDPPYIVKLNESGGSVGIDNKAVKATKKEVLEKVKDMITAYKMPVLIEQFIGGPEITAVVFDDGNSKTVYLAEKKFGIKPDGVHNFTSQDSYEYDKAYTYKFVDEKLEERIIPLVIKAFNVLKYKDYAKFDIRLGENDIPFFIDCNPNTAFGPDKGLPMTEVLKMYGVSFENVLLSLVSKHARIIKNKKVG
ncbi:hypothetical protein A3K34_02410 [candidate division WWE3 bacterium RIFOXYC1_FULL_40_10]|nr:MAG: hypothetical protein A3K58_02410 [candidate division WWE3 bacterium RIFOXYB1_FULL_40_22]OGC61704.1 MAG: hypothetical protein A3K37_02410 [candidate division WWE3 bacterium RIFOXYA1_FULL_40_11]OGC64878.1 MAG: hypothetical protein A2326_01235 [candidate division WWE3 bacterium RIFOXYB2_FULL_41_6]OGC66087.1 MAG: hypothetical protein A3K34_02410 [candidate division WWE3 bacterium RIFOXYC1_FULL_40_10]OGC67486.1 MAG: hypothetical protein A2450_03300 [candidate division WWE3 bacterium RIFOXYC2